MKKYTIHEQEREIVANDNVSFEVYEGELTVLSGDSGAGKSSILNCIYRTCIPTSGSIWFKKKNGDSIDLSVAEDTEILNLRRFGEIGFVTQFLRCLPRKTAIEVVAFPLIKEGRKKQEANELAAISLAQFALPEKLWTISPSTFSGGEMQRVNLARGFVNNPRLLLLDEPTASLDEKTASKIMENILCARDEQGMAILAIFHNRDTIDEFADKEVNVSLKK